MADFKITQLDRSLDFEHLDSWDVVIIGAGPAGLAASLTTAHRGLTTLVVEAKNRAGGQPEFFYPEKRIVDIPGFPDGITGEQLSQRTYAQAVAALVQFRFDEELIAVEDTDEIVKGDALKSVVTNQGRIKCRKVIIACGLLHFPRKLQVLDDLHSPRVHYRVPKVKDYEGQAVGIVGGGDSALDAAVMVLGRSGQVDVMIRKEAPAGKTDTLAQLEAMGGRVRTQTQIAAAEIIDDRIHATFNSGAQRIFDRIVVQIGFLSAKDTFERLDVRLNDDGSLAIDPYYETSRRGIFAVGDVHGDIKLIAVAWAEGIQAAIYAFKEITSPFWLSEKRLQDHKIAIIGDKLSDAAARHNKRP